MCVIAGRANIQLSLRTKSIVFNLFWIKNNLFTLTTNKKILMFYEEWLIAPTEMMIETNMNRICNFINDKGLIHSTNQINMKSSKSDIFSAIGSVYMDCNQLQWMITRTIVAAKTQFFDLKIYTGSKKLTNYQEYKIVRIRYYVVTFFIISSQQQFDLNELPNCRFKLLGFPSIFYLKKLSFSS